MNKGIIVFNPEIERWMFAGINEVFIGLHCGEHLEIKIFGRYRPCRLEYGEDWYVIFKDGAFELMRSQTYTVNYHWF